MKPDPKPITHRDPKYREFIRLKGCIVCNGPSVFHHESGLGDSGGMSKKCSDYFGIPLCHDPASGFSCHDDRERLGFITFYNRLGKDPWDLVMGYLVEYAQQKDQRVEIRKEIVNFIIEGIYGG